MDFNTMNNFNPMMAMQNGMGMPNFGMGMPSMMGESLRRNYILYNKLRVRQGMPAMNMDPSMMFNGGFGGMNGMNDMSAMMNMGMGMNGMGAFGGGMPGMGMNNGPNFFPAQGGFNQSSFGNQVNQNFHHNRGYGSRPYNRGFGRGRGFYNRGRGGWQNYGQHQGQNPNFVSQQTHQQQQQQNFQNNDESFDASAQSGARRGSPSYEPSKAADEDANGGNLQPRQTDSELPDATNTAEADTTNNVITDSTEVQENREDSTTTPRPLGDQGTEGKPTVRIHLSSSAHARTLAIAHAQARSRSRDDAHAETVYQDVATNFENVDAAGEPMDMADGAGGADTDAPREAMQNDSTTTTQDNAFAGQPHQEAYGYGARGRGGFRGGRGGLRGNVGAYGSVIALGEPDPMPAPPVNAPTGPKAMREGKPNSGWYSRPAQASAPVASPTAVETSKPPQPEDRGRSKSRSRSRSRHRSRKERRGSRDGDAESDEEYASRRDRKRRERKERERRRDGDGEEVKGDESSKKGRSRSESVEETSRHRHRDKDDDRYASRSHRAKSRDRRGRHHRSRSPAKDDLEVNGDGFDNSRYRSKKDRRHEEDYELDRSKTKDRSRKSSRRDNDYHEHKHHSHDTSRHGRSARDEGSRERQKHKPVLEEPQDEIGFKIKGSKSAALKAGLDTSMAPPTTFGRDRNSRRTSMQDFAPATPSTPASGDPYADERLKRQRDREQKHEDRRRQSMHSLGKRQSRDEDEEVPTGPKRDGDRGRGGKRSRKDGRRFSAKYEGEIGDAYEERDERRWR